jgi:uncharacterized protein YbcI
MAGASAERQEQGVIDGIKKAIKANAGNPVTVKAGSVIIKGVINADKYNGRQSSGSEPYTDVVLHLHNKKKINLSLKGLSAPSLAGGGLRGLELAVPGISGKFMKEAYKHLKNILKLNIGDKVPDVFGKIGSSEKLKIVVGNVAMGGPIDYMYIGPMSVLASYDTKKNIVTLNGTLTEADKYARTHDLYFRLRARREDQRFDPSSFDNSGIPKIYGKSPSKGDSAGRIVVTDKPAQNGIIVKI